MWDPELLAQGRTRVTFRPDLPGTLRGHRPPCAGRHRALVRGRELLHVPHDQRVGDRHRDRRRRVPDRRSAARRTTATGVPHIDVLRLEPYLHEWRLDLVTGTVRERALDDVMTEFPRMDNRRLGRPSRYAYSPRIAPASELLFDGFVKYDTTTGVRRAPHLRRRPLRERDGVRTAGRRHRRRRRRLRARVRDRRDDRRVGGGRGRRAAAPATTRVPRPHPAARADRLPLVVGAGGSEVTSRPESRPS